MEARERKLDIGLMAIEPLPGRDWLIQTQRILSAAGMRCAGRGQWLFAWSDQSQCGAFTYADACVVRRLWLAPKRWALGVHSKRIYFDSAGNLTNTPVPSILHSMSDPYYQLPGAALCSKNQWDLMQVLMQYFRHGTTPVRLKLLDDDLGKSRIVEIGQDVFSYPPDELNALYRKHGFFRVPDDFVISLCPLESVSSSVTDKFSRALKEAAERRRVALRLHSILHRDIWNRLDALGPSKANVTKGNCILFILPSSKQEPEGATVRLFDILESKEVPFRRAYADDPLRFSIPDQLPSLLMAAGGHPHSSPTKFRGRPLWTIGVDLSHSHDKAISILALTLVSPDGELLGAWTKAQKRDETVDMKSIDMLLRDCRKRLAEYAANAQVVVLRDGRIFENEDANLYGQVLECDVSLIEFRKRGNPQIINLSEPANLVSQMLAGQVPQETTIFMATAPPNDSRYLWPVSKVTWRKDWNKLGLSHLEIARVIAASAAAPGLGLHPKHLPAAIYWADGIAGSSSKDLRFIGIRVCRKM